MASRSEWTVLLAASKGKRVGFVSFSKARPVTTVPGFRRTAGWRRAGPPPSPTITQPYRYIALDGGDRQLELVVGLTGRVRAQGTLVTGFLRENVLFAPCE
jgi:hypothetical protein